MKKFTLAAAAAVAMGSTPAMAQDSATTVFIGPIAGYDNVKLSDGTNSESDDGIMYGIVAGADYQVSPGFFMGVEAEYSDSEVGETVTDIDVVGDSASIEAGRTIYTGARIGSSFGGSSKVYLKGGYVNLTVKGSYDDTVDTFTGSEDLGGWLAGIGMETRFNPVILRLEYRYSRFNNIEVAGFETGLDGSRNQVVAGALFSF
ncbi:MAG: outer membrane beta-barrel protein [Pseudomonadota bacterium]|nr:outer membrane beta-barrel protein [Pseudomonadota bacterium]